MTQTLPLTIVLGSTYTGLAIGYRVLNLNRTSYSAFTTTSVAETAVSGTYAVSGGIAAPNAGGYVIVGTAVTDYAESVIEPVGATGTGVSSKVYTVTIAGSPGSGVYVRMTTDSGGANNVDAGTTNAAGEITLHHDLAAGTTVYLWRSKAGIEFDDPDTEVI